MYVDNFLPLILSGNFHLNQKAIAMFTVLLLVYHFHVTYNAWMIRCQFPLSGRLLSHLYKDVFLMGELMVYDGLPFPCIVSVYRMLFILNIYIYIYILFSVREAIYLPP